MTMTMKVLQHGYPRTLPASRRAARRSARMLLVICDIVILTISFLIAGGLYGKDVVHTVLAGLHSTHGLFATSTLIPVYISFAVLGNAYGNRCLSSVRYSVVKSLQALMFAAFAFFVVLYFARLGVNLSRFVIGAGFLVATLLLPVMRVLANQLTLRVMGGTITTTLVLADSVPYPATDDEIVFTAEELGFDPTTQDPFQYHAFANAVTGADRIVIACLPERYRLWTRVLKSLTVQGEILPMDREDIGVIGIGHYHDRRTMIVAGGAMTTPDRISKRALDLVICIPALLLLVPVFLVVAIAVRLESRGPILFRQNRIGYDNKIFPMFKFRSMYIDMCDRDAVTLTQRVDPRVTRVGSMIRRTSLDELPQLLNVLLGTMSIVGPRPHPLSAKAADLLYWDVDDRYRHRHVIKPGLTGLAQVRGFRGNTEQVSDLTNRLEADLEYLAGWSITRDIKIILQTVLVLRHQNAF